MAAKSPVFLLVRAAENFGALYYASRVSNAFNRILRLADMGSQAKYYVLTDDDVKWLFGDQIDKLRTWAEGKFEGFCPLFVPMNFDEVLASKYTKKINL